MNILNLATTDEGGAGVACRNLNETFLQTGYNSVLVVKESTVQNKNVIVLKRPPSKNSISYYLEKIKNKLRHYYRKISPLERDEKYAFHNLNERKTHITAKKILDHTPFKPDVILVYWVTDFVNTRTMKALSEMTGAKIFWMMTDNAPLTGGCHYPWDCEGFQRDCSNCPAILTPSKKSIAQKNLAFKKANLPANLELISSSVSDHKRGLKASLFTGRKIHKIVAPIDEKVFKQGDKAAARQHFGVDTDTRVIFYGASSLGDPRKGAGLFLDALKILKRRTTGQGNDAKKVNFLILLAGREGFEHFKNIDIPVKEVGYLNQENLVKAYQAADFVVSPSVEDSGPMMVNQCIMCGTPMVTFDIGVAMDLVHNGQTGYRAKLFDAADFAEGMMRLLAMDEEERKKMADNCRNLALDNFTPDIYASKITSLF